MHWLSRQFENMVTRMCCLHLAAAGIALLLLLEVAAVAAAASLPGTATQHVTMQHVTTQDVVTAMTKHHLPVENVQITFPAGIAATVEAPILAVEQVTMRDARSANLRMACTVQGECPSFYVVVRWPNAPASLAADIAKVAPVPQAGAPTQPLHAVAHATLPAGAHATLLIDHEKVHIRLPVVCAQGGSIGDKIRVMTTNHRQTYEAVVLTDTEVQGSL